MNADHVAVSVCIGFPQTQMGILLCTTQYLFEYSNANLKSYERRFMVLTWFHEYLSNCVSSAVATEFCNCVQFGVDIFIPHYKYQFKPYLSL